MENGWAWTGKTIDKIFNLRLPTGDEMEEEKQKLCLFIFTKKIIKKW